MTINCKGKLITLTSPKVMGILNLTPDSFFDGGKYKNDRDFLLQTEKMLNEGATFIDLGAYSSRPNAAHVSETEELKRIVPIVNLLLKNFPEIIISIDTFRSSVANETINAGAAIVNDISAGNLDKNMFKTIAKLQVPYIIMHMQGTPQTMQQNPTYKNITLEIASFFSKKLNQLHQLKVNDVIIDVGFGFGKTIAHNFELLKNMAYFKKVNAPILVGISRKSMLYKPLKISPKEALNATTAAHTIALLNGANILRVHDVKEAIETIKITEQLNQFA
ncbi:dihydropteroate synthase [Tenacibaculum sp. UWU-22]|uniref:dihydropteroate synthase n=1 Tax=Tenacibaculum sp. UWU-22 TaxID=3234187 RepID=UPI0034DB1D14